MAKLTLDEQVARAQKVVAGWSPEKIARMRLEGTDWTHERIFMKNQYYEDEMLILSKAQSKKFGDKQKKEEKLTSEKPSAWLIPHLISFDGAISTSCPTPTKFEGTVGWKLSFVGDAPSVMDR